MATKAEQFKAEAQQSAHSTKARRATASGSKARATKPGAGRGGPATRVDRDSQVPNPATHNFAPRVAEQSSYELEVSATARPSRRSTRRSPAHIKPDNSLRIRAVNNTTSPQARASRSPRG